MHYSKIRSDNLPPNPYPVANQTLARVKACVAQLTGEFELPWEAEDGLDSDTEVAICLDLPKTHLIWDLAKFIAKTWEESSFFKSETIDLGFDRSSYPRRTQAEICDRITTYAEFLSACNGTTQATYCSGSGMAAGTFSESVDAFISDWVHARLHKLLELQGLEVIRSTNGESWSSKDCFMHEVGFISEDGELPHEDCCNRIDVASVPYTECGHMADFNTLASPARFKDWTLWDFQQIIRL